VPDEQDQAESLDEDVVDDVDDYDGDEFGDGLPGYPPEAPLGVNTAGVTVDEEEAGESFAERTWREEPDVGEPGARTPPAPHLGQLVDPLGSADEPMIDHEAAAIADEVGGDDDGPEAGALHLEE
jgi:hypothetical protein